MWLLCYATLCYGCDVLTHSRPLAHSPIIIITSLRPVEPHLTGKAKQLAQMQANDMSEAEKLREVRC